jgi:antitoxin component YwqK of YwqJK toxin-antitoxin module
MKVIFVLSSLIVLVSCTGADYTLNKTAFCTGIGEPDSSVSCEDKNKRATNGTIVEFWENGKKHRFFSTVDGLADGDYMVYNNQEILRAQHQMKQGKMNGLSKQYYDDGKLESEMFTENGKANGLGKEYYQNGNLRLETTYKDNKPEGLVKHYYENGNLSAEAIYKNDKPEGLAKQYYETGELRWEQNMKNGQLNGQTKQYYEDGTIKTDVVYKNGKMNGTYKQYYETGELQVEALFKDGKQTGIQKEFYTDGKIKAERPYKNDKLNGTVKIYDSNGKIQQEQKFRDGKSIGDAYNPVEKCEEQANVCCGGPLGVLFTNGECFRKKGCRVKIYPVVSGINKDGVLTAKNSMFIYTNQKYVNGQSLPSNYYYEYTGTYEYKTVAGSLNRVDAFKQTKIPVCDD